MKKSFVIVFIVLYASFNIGAQVNIHYCCGKLYHVTLFTQPENCCELLCCNNSSYELKIHDAYVDNENLKVNATTASLITELSEPAFFSWTFPKTDKTDKVNGFCNTGPSVPRNNSIYLTNRVFLI